MSHRLAIVIVVILVAIAAGAVLMDSSRLGQVFRFNGNHIESPEANNLISETVTTTLRHPDGYEITFEFPKAAAANRRYLRGGVQEFMGVRLYRPGLVPLAPLLREAVSDRPRINELRREEIYVTIQNTGHFSEQGQRTFDSFRRRFTRLAGEHHGLQMWAPQGIYDETIGSDGIRKAAIVNAPDVAHRFSIEQPGGELWLQISCPLAARLCTGRWLYRGWTLIVKWPRHQLSEWAQIREEVSNYLDAHMVEESNP